MGLAIPACFWPQEGLPGTETELQQVGSAVGVGSTLLACWALGAELCHLEILPSSLPQPLMRLQRLQPKHSA